MTEGTRDFDLFVIGGGSAGVRAARIAAGHGARVGLAEESRVGGTCVIRGCVPKKLMVFAARYADDFADAAGFGWSVGDTAFDWPTLIASKDREIDRLNAAYRRGLERAGVSIIPSRAVLQDAHTIRLGDGRTVTAGTILIATGGHPHVDRHIPGVEHAITSDEMFHLERLPERIVILGGGFIAVEFAGILRGLGAEVAIVHRGSHILRGFDDEMRRALQAAMAKRGIAFHCDAVLTAVEKTPTGLVARTSTGVALPADQVLLAIGRTPNSAGIGLAEAGVELDPAGAAMVDHAMRTTVPNIYAVGDVTNRVNLTPVAIREGHAFADTVFGGRATTVDHRDIPHAVFGTPELGAVGLTEETAREQYPAVDIYRAGFQPMRNQLSGRDERMLMKLVVDGDSDRLLGCHILGPEAAEMVQLVAVAIKLRATKADLDATMALHPTLAEELVTMRTPSERHRRTAAD
ncbi:MAG: glutathione-disulfide reductase [Reyranella sp.]